MTHIVVAFSLQIVGLFCTIVGSVILLRGLFITDAQINKLTELPIHASNNFGHGDHRFASTDPDKLESYKSLYVQERMAERRKGRIALWLFIVGFVLQLAGLGVGAPFTV